MNNSLIDKSKSYTTLISIQVGVGGGIKMKKDIPLYAINVVRIYFKSIELDCEYEVARTFNLDKDDCVVLRNLLFRFGTKKEWLKNNK